MRTRPLLCISACLAVAFLLLAYPIYVIRPFRHQGEHELAAALVVMRYRPAVEVGCMSVAAITVFFAWRAAQLSRKIILAAGFILVAGCDLLCHINVYEKMFHPLDEPTFSRAAETKLDPAEEVIAVIVNNQARAYPIRDISYHHIVNDTLGGRAIVATY